MNHRDSELTNLVSQLPLEMSDAYCAMTFQLLILMQHTKAEARPLFLSKITITEDGIEVREPSPTQCDVIRRTNDVLGRYSMTLVTYSKVIRGRELAALTANVHSQ